MKIKTTTTEIECTADELRQSNTVADGFLNIMRRAFNGPIYSDFKSESEDEDPEEAADGDDN